MTASAITRGLDVNLRSAPQLLEYQAIVTRLAADRPGRILDWGCGWGQVSHLLKRAGLDVTAFDYRPERGRDGVYRLERFPDVEAHVSATDPRTLPFESASFGAVLSCGVLEHVLDPHASLEEIRRVLEPGGTFYVYKLPNRYSYLEWVAKRMGLYYHGADPTDAVYTKRSALALLEGHGFQVREIRGANLLPLTLDHALATRAAGAIWRANRALSAIPGLNLVATNLELVATAPR